MYPHTVAARCGPPCRRASSAQHGGEALDSHWGADEDVAGAAARRLVGREVTARQGLATRFHGSFTLKRLR